MNQVNETLLQRAHEALELSTLYQELEAGTIQELMLANASKWVMNDVDSSDLENLYNVSLPHLERLIKDCMVKLFEQEYYPL